MSKQNIVLVLLVTVLMLGLFSGQNLSTSYDGLGIAGESELYENYTISGDGDAWLAGYTYRTELNFYEVAGAGENYHIRVHVEYDDSIGATNAVDCGGHCQTDFGDIVFTSAEGSEKLDYWIEEKTNSDDATFWVEVSDDLSSGTKLMWVYYGTSGTTSTESDGDETFIWFDDFSSDNLAKTGSTITVSSGEAHWDSTSVYGDGEDEVDSQDTGFAISGHFNWDLAPNTGLFAVGLRDAYGSSYNDENDWIGLRLYDDDRKARLVVEVGGSGTAVEYSIVSLDTDYWFRAGVSGTTAYLDIYDDNDLSTIDSQGSTSFEPTEDLDVVSMHTRNIDANDGEMNYLYVHKWQFSAPYIITSGNTEETAFGPSVDDVAVIDATDNVAFYAQLQEYTFTINVSDANGATDINYVELRFINAGASTVWSVRYTRGTTTFSEVTNPSQIELNITGSSASVSGDDLDVTWKITFEWGDFSDDVGGFRGYVIDSLGLDDSAEADSSYHRYIEVDCKTDYDLALVAGSEYDRFDYDTIGNVNMGATLVYAYTSKLVPDNAVDVYITADGIAGSAWDNTTFVDGEFIISCDTDDVVGIDTYILKVVEDGGGSGGTDLLISTQDIVIISDTVVISVISNTTYAMINEYVMISATAEYGYDGATFVGTFSWNDTVGAVTKVVVGIHGYEISSITDTQYGLTSFSGTIFVTVYWDSLAMSSNPAYKWTQYSPDEVWLVVDTAKFYWSNSGLDADGIVIQTKINGTDDDWGRTNTNGYIGDLVLGGNPTNGAFDSSWYGANISLYWEYHGNTGIIWSVILSVDILHSIHIETQQFYLTDNWVTIGIQTNWNNATFYVWDNITGTPVYQGGAYEGFYQIAKSTDVGAHSLIILVNGTQGTIDVGSQVAGTTDTSDWEYLEFTYTVNPVTFSITDPFAMQNNESIIFSAIFYTGDLTIDYTIYEDGIAYKGGVLNIPSSGSYYVLKWEKSSAISTANWTIVLQSGTTNITIYGYNIILQNADYTFNSSGWFEGDTVIMGESVDLAIARAEDSKWDTIGTIMLLITMPVVVGIALRVDRSKGKPRGKRDKMLDNLR